MKLLVASSVLAVYFDFASAVVQCAVSESATATLFADGCGCGDDEVITAVTSTATNAYCNDCANGYIYPADTTPAFSADTCVLGCGSVDDATGKVIANGCGCGVNQAITAVTTAGHTEKAYCVACATGYIRPADKTDAYAVAPCVVKQCGSANDDTGLLLSGGCGCGLNEAITAVGDGSSARAYCVACATGHGRPADIVDSTALSACVLQCGIVEGSTAQVIADGCGCGLNQAITAVTTAGHTEKAYCVACAAGKTRPADPAFEVDVDACTAVADKCSGNFASDTDLAEEHDTDGTFQFACGAGFAVKDSTIAFSGSTDLEKKAACCAPVFVIQCGSVEGANAQVIAGGCGCGVNEAITAVTTDGHTDKAYCKACDPGYTRPVDTIPAFAVEACTVVKQCGSANDDTAQVIADGCGCEVNEAITAVTATGITGKAYCVACATGYIRPVDTAPATAVAACVLGCGSVDDATGKVIATGCGCGLNEAITAVTTAGHTEKAYCKACATGKTRAADKTTATAVAACVLQCGSVNDATAQVIADGCGCGLNEEITAVTATGITGKAYCKACATGYIRPVDTAEVNAVEACTVLQCGSANDATGQVIATGCGCGVNQAITAVTATGITGKAYCVACATGYTRPIDTAPATAVEACTVLQCGSVNDATAQVIADGCGCGLNEEITAVTATGITGKAYCKACATGFYRPVNTVPATAVQACTVLQCGTSEAGGILKTAGCGCPADHEVKELASDPTKLYCTACGTGHSRPMDLTLVKIATACTAVAGKCSGNKETATDLELETESTFGFNCGTGFTVKSKASALSGTDAAARKVACCTVTQCGGLPGILKTEKCGCATNEEIKEPADTTRLYCAPCSTGKVRSVSTTAVGIAEPCAASSAPTTSAPTVAPTSNSTATAPTNASTVVTINLTSTVLFKNALTQTQKTSVTASYSKAVGTVDDITPKCSIKSSTRRRLLAESVSYLLTATFVVNKSAISDFTKKATAKQETAKANFLKDSDVLDANGGTPPTYTSNTVTVDGVDVATAAPTDDDNEIDFSGSSALAVSFGVICSMLL